MLFSVMSGRIRISRAERVIVAISSRPARTGSGLREARPGSVVAGSVRPARTEGGLTQARAGSDTPGLPESLPRFGVAASAKRSFRQSLLERQQAGSLEHHAMGVQQLVDRHVGRRLDGQPRHVARRTRHRLGQLAHDEQRRLARESEGGEHGHQRLRLSVADLERLDRGQLAGRDLGRDGRAQRPASHLARHVLVVAPGRRAERLAPTLPLYRPGRALPGPAGPLLLPWLAAAPRHLAPALGVVRAGPTVGELARHGLVEQRHADLGAEHIRLQLQRAGRFALRVEHLDGRHRYFFSATFCACCVLVAFTDLRSITRDPLAPGTAPRTSTRFCSGITRTTTIFSTVRRSPPMRPGMWWPGHTREGSDDAPMDPGARWNIEPCVASPPYQP